MRTLDRDAQRRLLAILADAYPGTVLVRDIKGEESTADLSANLAYLEEHKLASVSWSRELSSVRPNPIVAKATAAGLDFLSDDGGLSAILGTVVVRLHDDSLRALLIQRVNASDADPTVKSKLIDQLKSLPAQGIAKLAEAALQAGIQHLPNAVQWLHTTLSR